MRFRSLPQTPGPGATAAVPDGSRRAPSLRVGAVRHRVRHVEELTGRGLRPPLDRMDLAPGVGLG
jgi:hypothetical protein